MRSDSTQQMLRTVAFAVPFCNLIKPLFMKKSLFILGLLGMIALTYSCSKDDDNSVSSLTKTEMIARTWKITAIDMTVAGETFNVLDSLPSCVKDNIYKFTAAGIYSSEEGLTKCNDTDPTVVETGTWLFMLSETKLKMNVSSWSFPDSDIPWSDEIIWDITSLSATKMQLDYVIPADGTNPEMKLRVTFTAV